MRSAVITATNEFQFEEDLERKLSFLKLKTIIDIKFSTTSVVITEERTVVKRTYKKEKIVTTYSALILYE